MISSTLATAFSAATDPQWHPDAMHHSFVLYTPATDISASCLDEFRILVVFS